MIETGKILCIPPYELLKENGNIVVYGAGVVGREYVKCLLKSRFSEIIGWVDLKYGYELYGITIMHPKEILNMVFDEVLIGVDNADTALQIKRQMMDYGVNENRIVWKPVWWG